MPQVPPLPTRKDSLQNHPRRTPPVPQWPRYSSHQGARARSHLELYSTQSESTHKVMTASPESPSDQLTVEPSDTYVFESRAHAKDAFKMLQEFFGEQEMCDVEIKVGNKSIKCHRVVLACISLYFRAMFKSDMAESRLECITIQDLDEGAMENLIEFCYTSRIKITTENVQPILFASSILQIESVAEACANFMKSHLHPSNCLEVIFLPFC